MQFCLPLGGWLTMTTIGCDLLRERGAGEVRGGERESLQGLVLHRFGPGLSQPEQYHRPVHKEVYHPGNDGSKLAFLIHFLSRHGCAAAAVPEESRAPAALFAVIALPPPDPAIAAHAGATASRHWRISRLCSHRRWLAHSRVRSKNNHCKATFSRTAFSRTAHMLCAPAPALLENAPSST